MPNLLCYEKLIFSIFIIENDIEVDKGIVTSIPEYLNTLE